MMTEYLWSDYEQMNLVEHKQWPCKKSKPEQHSEWRTEDGGER